MSFLSRTWDQFQLSCLTKQVLPYTLVSPARVHNLYCLARRIEKEQILGDVIECGVCNGGTAAVLARVATHSHMQRTVWLFDSFQGMPQTTPEDGIAIDGHTAEQHIGKEVGDPARVKEVLRKVGADLGRVKIVPGWFQDTFPSASEAISQIALLNIDADWYESVKLCLETFYDRITPGGFISLDDYGHWPGCKLAADNFLRQRQLPYELKKVDYTAHWFRKE
jgi:O-methyltransferase